MLRHWGNCFLTLLAINTSYWPMAKMRIMAKKQKSDKVAGMVALPLVLLNGIIIKYGFIGNEKWLWWLLITIPLLLIVVVSGSDVGPRSVLARKRHPARRSCYSFETDQHDQLARRQRSHYIRFRVFTRS